MAFNGKYQLKTQEGYKEFTKAIDILEKEQLTSSSAAGKSYNPMQAYLFPTGVASIPGGIAAGLENIIKKMNDLKTTYEIEEKGDYFKVTAQAGAKVVRSTFTIGQETKMEFLFGEPVKTVVNREGKKLKAMLKNITSVWELVDPNTLVITLSTPDNIAYKRIFIRVA